MFYVYILFSTFKSKYYIGQTSDIEERLFRHNYGFSLSTNYGIPWELVQTFICETRSDAIQLEKKIKKRGAKRFLEDLNKSE
jgi:putative endonuclease